MSVVNGFLRSYWSLGLSELPCLAKTNSMFWSWPDLAKRRIDFNFLGEQEQAGHKERVGLQESQIQLQN